jgi:hypothetical protein
MINGLSLLQMLTSVLSYAAAVLFGVAIKTLFDYYRGKMLLQKKKQYQREQEIEDWKIEIHRVVRPFVEEYTSMNPSEKEDRGKFQEVSKEMKTDLETLYDDRPYGLDREVSEQVLRVIDEVDSYLEINPNSKPVLIRSDPIGEAPFSDWEYKKGFKKRTKDLREEVRKLLNMTN